MTQNPMDLFGVDLNDTYMRSCEEQIPAKEKPLPESLNAAQRALVLLLRDKGVEKINCFGGLLFQREDANGNRILSFAVEDMTDGELSAMKKEYQAIYRSALPRLISRADPFVEQAEPYTVFNFEYNPGISFRQYCRNNKKEPPSARVVMRKLVNILIDRSNRHGEENYESLNCLSLDTLFLDNQGEVWLLPLRAFRNQFPREIAPEAHDPTQKCTVASDLCAAAYVAVLVANNGELPAMVTLQDSKIKECLMLIPQCRPTLNTMGEALGSRMNSGTGRSAGTAAPDAPDGNPKSAPKKSEGISFIKVCKEFLSDIWKKLKGLFVWESQGEINRTQKDHTSHMFRRFKQIEETEEDRL